MELYDKKYVYFEWDDKLKGKKGFVGTNISYIKKQVNKCTDTMTEIYHSSDNTQPFTTGYYNYSFAYYDPNYEAKKAYNEGKKLQWKYRNEKDWKDWDNDAVPEFRDDTCGYELRVKPEDIDYDTGVIGNKVLDRPLTKEPDNHYFKDGEMKSYSKEAVEYARNRVSYEMSYTCGMDFTDEQIKWIKDHIYISVRKAYQDAYDGLQENEENRAHCISSNEYEYDRLLTNKEFAMWLAKGNGQWKQIKYGLIQTSDAYIGQDDETIDYDILVRRWEDEDWHKPTYNYCFK